MTAQILVADDEPRYVRLMEANLVSEGFQVFKGCHNRPDRKAILGLDTNICQKVFSRFPTLSSDKINAAEFQVVLGFVLHLEAGGFPEFKLTVKKLQPS